MPDLFHSLRSCDLGHLRIVAELWGLDLRAEDTQEAAHELAAALLNPGLRREVIAALPPEAASALDGLARAGGKIPWAGFARQFGDVREMGASRRDRERPYLKPASPSETLFYRGLLARAFFDTENGPQEFAYVPDDLLALIKSEADLRRPEQPAPHEPLGRRATPAERRQVIAANDRILDEATTFLAALRAAVTPPPDAGLRDLLETAALTRNGELQAAATKAFLEAPRAQAMKGLVEAWGASTLFNELRLLPGIVCEGEWRNDPLAARRFLLGVLAEIPGGTWWSLASLVEALKTRSPDFQRPAGDYDSWFIKDSDGNYLRGYDTWDRVDGALIRFIISDVMFRLGLVDLAAAEGAYPTAFRVWAAQPEPADYAARFTAVEDARLKVNARGTVAVPRLAPRAVRYQLARFCEWEGEKDDVFRYRITPRSLTQAGRQGLKPEHLLVLLARHGDAGIPPALVKALKRWEAHGTEARSETQTVLRVARPEILEQLRKTRAARYLGEPLGPTSVIIKHGALQKVAEAMTELGVLMEDEPGESPQT